MEITEFIHDSGFRQLLSSEFTSEDQKLFVESFTTYQYVIDFDDVWKWAGFTRKDNAKTMLTKYFKKDTDFKVESLLLRTQEQNRGGHNKQNIFLNVNTFKDFCDDVKREFNMSPKSVKKYCNDHTIKNGFLWRFA